MALTHEYINPLRRRVRSPLCVACGLFSHSVKRAVKHLRRVTKCAQYYMANVSVLSDQAFEAVCKDSAKQSTDKKSLRLPAVRNCEGGIAGGVLVAPPVVDVAPTSSSVIDRAASVGAQRVHACE